TRDVNDNLKDEFSLIELDNRLEIMALKKCEKSDDFILRIKNSNDFDIENITLKINTLINEVYVSSLREEKIDKLDINEGKVTINKIKKNSFLTLMLKQA
ncbi:MAG: glycosyl hydrolase-related protein, partial [Paraclostridium bifermentans]